MLPLSNYIPLACSICIASAESLGLPSLPQDIPVHDRRRQIAGRLGVIME